MQVKKFEAPTMQEALKVIKRELGPEAIILSTKENRKGFGLMSKTSVEVTAAIAEKDLKKKINAEKGLPQKVKEKIWNSTAEKQAEVYDTYFERQLKEASKDKVEINSARARQNQAERTELRKPIPAPVAAPAQRARPQPQPQRAAAPQPQRANNEVRYADILDEEPTLQSRARLNVSVPANDKNERVKTLESDIEQLKVIISDLSKQQESGAARAADINENFLGDQVQLQQELISSGIEKRYAREIVKKAAFDLSPEQRQDTAVVQEKLAEILYEEIHVSNLLSGVGAAAGNAKTSVVALVGPTGVGKTTTIAKIASKGILESRLRVGLINLDSYKVAAADQLATYARIMGVPFRSVTTTEEFQQAIYDFSSLDLVLIDTTGRSQKDQESLLQLRHVLGAVENLQSVLMVSATTKETDTNDILTRFKIFNPVGLIFSKLDETGLYGSIYNAHKRTGLPLLYFTIGQRVPEDIELASRERVVDLVLDL